MNGLPVGLLRSLLIVFLSYFFLVRIHNPPFLIERAHFLVTAIVGISPFFIAKNETSFPLGVIPCLDSRKLPSLLEEEIVFSASGLVFPKTKPASTLCFTD